MGVIFSPFSFFALSFISSFPFHLCVSLFSFLFPFILFPIFPSYFPICCYCFCSPSAFGLVSQGKFFGGAMGYSQTLEIGFSSDALSRGHDMGMISDVPATVAAVKNPSSKIVYDEYNHERFVLSMSASKDVLALASLEFDLSSIELGSTVTVKWRGKPVFIRHRTEEDIKTANSVDLASQG
ncbi:hypothetical protein E1A91_D12G101200v1 [Gossypium mustelinum]|uniref:Cytochrome b-c1 complex subunit Rieske transmembrane domain-containing protein n=1 Tax=Gossypium mustelinum TaxID=34275 RepID=A0A5D2SDR0_GOSMU|nr:hypothetical protein E1A91_D12G101200v1 [Gossypium mustelinum]